MQTRLDDINNRVDDLTTRLKALGLQANMNQRRKRDITGMMLTASLSLNRFVQILVVSMITSAHLMKKIEVILLEIIGIIKITV